MSPAAAAGHGEALSLRRATVERLEALGLRPSRDLGQNFLVDERILDAVEDAAELSGREVVLEVGGGLGVLSERLAGRVAHLHVVELDRGLAGALADTLAPLGNATLHHADAVRLDFGALHPLPGKLVANLPYGVAATVVLKAIEELVELERAVVMVQREVGERLAAAPGSRTYGATSVLAQLACAVRVHRRVPRSAFHPSPNVESAIVVLRRVAPSPSGELRGLVRAAFAHRRKTLAGSLALAGRGGENVRERARAALVSLGLPPDARAERLAPADFEALARALGEAAPTPATNTSAAGPDRRPPPARAAR